VLSLKVPGSLEYRDLAMRFVAAACRLAQVRAVSAAEARRPDDEFDDHVISAVGEAFNNAVLHGDGGESDVEIEIQLAADRLTVRLLDFGSSFDLAAVPTPDLDRLPESGMGLYIIRACMNEVTYEPGRPNVLSMTRHNRLGGTTR
jgi:serine/threonine-protein kinase RsbW